MKLSVEVLAAVVGVAERAVGVERQAAVDGITDRFWLTSDPHVVRSVSFPARCRRSGIVPGGGGPAFVDGDASATATGVLSLTGVIVIVTVAVVWSCPSVIGDLVGEAV